MRRLVFAALLVTAGCAPPGKMVVATVADPEVVIETIPRGATVSEAGQPLGTTPLLVRARNRSENRRWLIERRGFLSQHLSLTGQEFADLNGQRLLVPLRPDTWDPKGKTLRPDDAGHLARAGVELARRERCPEAIAFLQRAVEVNPRAAPALKVLGACFAKSGMRGRALDAYKRYLLVAPDEPDAQRVREIVSRAEGDIDLSEPEAP